jgi:exonuclease SbcD
MRLLHTADLHLGKVLHEQSLLEDQASALDRLASELEGGGYHLFVVAGDVFDRSVPPPEAVSLWDDFLHRITRSCPSLETVVVAGNHDGAQRLAFASRFLDAHRVHIRTKASELDVPVTVNLDGREWDVFAVPFLQAGTLQTVTPEGEPAALRSQRELWEQALVRLAAARRPGVPAVLVTHLFTLGGSESDSERLFVGEAEQIPSSWLTGWDYVALGHLHQAQQPAPGVRYSGSPLAYSFSEAGQQKVALRWDDGAVTAVALPALRPLTRLSGSFEDFARGEGYEDYRSHWLELTLTDAALVPGPLERLRARFPGLLSLVQAPARAAAVLEPTQRRRTGDTAADTLRFLAEVGIETDPEMAAAVSGAVKEVSVEAS